MNIIAACGNDCAVCPRHLPKSETELHETAVLWKNIGCRDTVVSNEEIACFGCVKGSACRYGIIDCVSEKQIHNCGECEKYPCALSEKSFIATEKFREDAKNACDNKTYEELDEAFFHKKDNLDAIKNA